jgi:hypothetical protein
VDAVGYRGGNCREFLRTIESSSEDTSSISRGMV